VTDDPFALAQMSADFGRVGGGLLAEVPDRRDVLGELALAGRFRY
jgi:hypothetical protein